MKYAFNTFSCPDLDLHNALALAHRHGYDGIEPRVGSGHSHGIELHTDVQTRREICQVVERSGIAICCLALGSHYANPATTDQKIAETMTAIDLAADIGAPRLRVFGGDIPADVSRAQAIDLVVAGLRSVAEYALQRGVDICLETHDSWSDPTHVREVMERIDLPAIAVTWDVMHPVRAAGRTMEEAFDLIGPWVRHVHMHDGTLNRDLLEFRPIGTGDLDHRQVLHLLMKSEYQGFLSGEWIGWDEPETYLPHELATMRQYERELARR